MEKQPHALTLHAINHQSVISLPMNQNKEKNVFDVYFFVWSVTSTNMEEVGIVTYTAASHQGG